MARYTIWRVSPGGHNFALTTLGTISSKDRALEKVRAYNERLLATEPDTQDRFVVKDDSGRELQNA